MSLLRLLMKSLGVTAACAVAGIVTIQTQSPPPDFEKLPFAPRHAICYRTSTPLQIDGRLDEPAWRAAPWSDAFIDIDGTRRPPLATRMQDALGRRVFLLRGGPGRAGPLGNAEARDSVIFQDNDFEVFIDPGRRHARLLRARNQRAEHGLGSAAVQPYRDGGPAIHAWDIAGLAWPSICAARSTARTIRTRAGRSRSRSPGRSWPKPQPQRRAPRAGEQWRVNFSRVQWQLDVAGWPCM